MSAAPEKTRLRSIQITLVAVLSLDGCLTKGNQPGVGFASKADQAWFRSALEGFDASIMGRNTFDAARSAVLAAVEKPSRRLRIVMTRHPENWTKEWHPERLEFTDRPPAETVADLTRRGKTNCVILGGSSINRLFLAANLVDRLWLTFEPVIFGSGRRLVDREVETRFQFESVENLDASTVLLKYRRN
ncbi:MAG: dihydrofolate reductase [Opitutaceae bacterium]